MYFVFVNIANGAPSYSSGALRHGIQFSRKNYARSGHMTRFFVNGRGVTYIHSDTSTRAHCLSSAKFSIEFAEVKNDENELEVWRLLMFFGELAQT